VQKRERRDGAAADGEQLGNGKHLVLLRREQSHELFDRAAMRQAAHQEKGAAALRVSVEREKCRVLQERRKVRELVVELVQGLAVV
jgi:hypothetical protein